MSQLKIANSIQDIGVGQEARFLGTLLDTLKDVDAQRIAASDDVVIRKGVLGLLAVVGRLEERIVELETAVGLPPSPTADGARS